MAKTKKGEKKVCYPCKTGDWLFPLAIIGLVWFGPVTMWPKVVITILAALMFLSNVCPCRKK